MKEFGPAYLCLRHLNFESAKMQKQIRGRIYRKGENGLLYMLMTVNYRMIVTLHVIKKEELVNYM